MRLASLIVVAAVSGCATLECSKHGGPGVRSIRSAHFVVSSGVPLRRHQGEVQRLELLWDTFAEFFGTNVEHSQIEVVVLGDADEAASFSPGNAGYLRRINARALVLTNIEGTRTGAHELTHLVSAFMLPRQPRWLAEGLAALFEDADFIDSRTVVMGRWSTRARTAYERVLSLDELRAWKGEPVALYSSAWAWVHYLINHDEPRLKRLFTALRGRDSEKSLMAEIFPPADATRLQAEVAAYVRNATFRGWKTLLRRTPQLEKPIDLADWEVHLLRAALHTNAEERRTELERAEALAPRPLPGRLAVARRVAAREDASDLIERHPDEPDVSVAVWGEYNADADIELLRRQVRAHPDNPSLLLLAGNVELAEGQLDAADELAQRGSALAPWSLPLASLQMRVSLDKHECAALEHFERMLSLAYETERPEAIERMRSFERVVRACKPR